MSLPVNMLLHAGSYRIVRFLSSGGFGCTYLGERVINGRRIAIKEFFPDKFCIRDADTFHISPSTDGNIGIVSKLKQKFIDEATALMDLRHRGIVRVFDVFEEYGTAYYVMDYIEGESLAEKVDREGALPESEVLCYFLQVADALRYLHGNNRLHLDIKPANIMVNADNQAILIDFGTSKQYDEASGKNTSILMGLTPGYAPIEQMQSAVQQFYPATDIYALGATLYKLTTGHTPPGAAEVLEHGLPILPSYLSTRMRRVIIWAMQPRRKDRYQSVEAMIADMNKQEVKEGDTNNDDTSLDTKVASPKSHKVDHRVMLKEPIPAYVEDGKASPPQPKSDRSVGRTLLISIGIALVVILVCVYLAPNSKGTHAVVPSSSTNQEAVMIAAFDDDGNYLTYTITDWQNFGETSKQLVHPVGVQVNDGVHQLIVGVDKSFPVEDFFNPKGDSFVPVGQSLPIYTDYTSALNDYNGLQTTHKIKQSANQWSDYYPALNRVSSYPTTNSQSRLEWYIPALGELRMIYENKDDINIALKHIGSTGYGGYEWYISSTPSDIGGTSVWIFNFKSGDAGDSHSWGGIIPVASVP